MRFPTKTLAVLFALAIISLSAYSYNEIDRHLPYPTMDEIRTDYRSHVGKRVSIFGTVVEATERAAIVSSDGLNFKVNPLTADVGDRAEVLGILLDNYQIITERSVVYDWISYHSVFLNSLVGAALLAMVFLKGWKFEARKMRFVERG